MGSTDEAGAAFALEDGGGEATWFVGQLATVKMGSDETKGRCALLEFVTPAGGGAPYHVHQNEDESFYVLEGEITFYVGAAVIHATAGSFVFGPRKVPHTFVVGPHGPARYLLFTEPAGFDRFVAEAGVPAEARTLPPPLDGPPDIAALAETAKKYGIEILAHRGRHPRGRRHRAICRRRRRWRGAARHSRPLPSHPEKRCETKHACPSVQKCSLTVSARARDTTVRKSSS
jgi:quercetin dioxygenase-like cupin family protein